MSFDDYYEGSTVVPPKLPLWDAVSLSYSSYFANLIDALRASWLWLILAAAFTSVASWQQWSWMASVMANVKPGVLNHISRPIDTIFVVEFDNIFVLLAGVSIAVAWHRLLILGEHPGLSGSNVVTKNLWRYIFIAVALFLIMLLPLAIIMLPAFYFLAPATANAPPSAGFFVTIPIILILSVIAYTIALRLSPMLPAQAIGDRDLTFKQTWDRTRGNFWRLFWGIAFTTIPPVLILQIAFLLIAGFPVPGAGLSEGFVTRMTAASTIFMVYYLLITPIGIGFLSHAYLHFFKGGLDPESQA